MKNGIGVWIDHDTAYVVHSDGSAPVQKIESGLGDQHEKSGSPNSHFSDGRKNELHSFFHKIAATLGTSEDILLLGPGTAKNEMKDLLADTEKHRHLRFTVEAAQQVSEAQLKELVQAHFGHPAKRHLPEVPGQPSH